MGTYRTFSFVRGCLRLTKTCRVVSIQSNVIIFIRPDPHGILKESMQSAPTLFSPLFIVSLGLFTLFER
jgi:hypothetical protein